MAGKNGRVRQKATGFRLVRLRRTDSTCGCSDWFRCKFRDSSPPNRWRARMAESRQKAAGFRLVRLRRTDSTCGCSDCFRCKFRDSSPPNRWRARMVESRQKTAGFRLVRLRRTDSTCGCSDCSRCRFRDSSMVEHAAVNRRVAGSSPARGAVRLAPSQVAVAGRCRF